MRLSGILKIHKAYVIKQHISWKTFMQKVTQALTNRHVLQMFYSQVTVRDILSLTKVQCFFFHIVNSCSLTLHLISIHQAIPLFDNLDITYKQV